MAVNMAAYRHVQVLFSSNIRMREKRDSSNFQAQSQGAENIEGAAVLAQNVRYRARSE